MALSSLEYWREREEAALESYLKDEDEYAKQINSIYDYLCDRIQKEIDSFYAKYAASEGMTMAEAKKAVSKLDIEEYGRKAAKYVADKDFSAKANAEMKLYNATMKINRLELLKSNIGLEMVSSFDELDTYMGGILTDRARAEFKRQAGILGDVVKNIDKAADTIVRGSFKNATFSDRIWMYQDMLKGSLVGLLSQGLIQGRNPKVLAKDLRELFGVQKYQAERLMRTEMARVQIEAQKQSFVAGGYEQYIFIATLDSKTCETCGEMDGKVFNVKDMETALNAPPMHPNCRCSTAAASDAAVLYATAKEVEPDVTKDLMDIGGSVGAELQGLDYRLKTEESIHRKLVKEFPKTELRDVLRYTYELSEDNFAEQYGEIVENLTSKGYNISRVKNSWLDNDNPYNGLNTNVLTPDGYEFEIQYHTADSLKIKEQIHPMYEKQRLLNQDSKEAEILKAQMMVISNSQRRPNGIEGIR